MKLPLLPILVVSLVVLVAAMAGPLLGLQALRDALSRRDEAALLAAVDTDRLRASLTARVRARYAGADGTPPVQPVVEKLLTAEGLIAAVCDGGVVAIGGPQREGCEVHSSLGDLRFESLDRFSAALTQGGRIAATVVMDRDGLRWRLVDMVLPVSAYDQIKNSALN